MPVAEDSRGVPAAGDAPSEVAGYGAFEDVRCCPICSSPDRATLDADAAVVGCLGCGHRYVDPRPTQTEIARGYSLPTSYDDWIEAADDRNAMWRRRFDRVLGRARPGRLLDVGAGIGTFLAIARDHGWSIEGTEVSTTAIARARELHDIVIRPGLAEDAAPAGPFDAVCLWHVIEHLPDPDSTLRFCHGLLADHGAIILAMPNDGRAAWVLTGIGNAVRRALGRQPSPRYLHLRPGVESHIQHFDERSIRRLLAQTGFAIRSVTVDDASPRRSRVGALAYRARVLLTRLTPWNVGREMVVVAGPIVRASSPTAPGRQTGGEADARH